MNRAGTCSADKIDRYIHTVDILFGISYQIVRCGN